MKNIFLIIIVALIVVGCEKPLVQYEEPTGKISGFVKMKGTDAPLKDIFVVFENIQNGALHGTMSKADGSFAFGALITGDYKIYGVQDTMKLGAADTLKMKVNDGESVKLNDVLKMEPAGVPALEVPIVVEKTHNSVTIRVNYNNNGSKTSAYGLYYVNRDEIGRDPIQSDTRKGFASYSGDIIRKDHFQAPITGLSPNTTYSFRGYIGIANYSPYKSHTTAYNVAWSGVITVTTDPKP